MCRRVELFKEDKREIRSNMNTALILAAGIDARFQMDVPKQFVNVNNRPMIVYTLEKFQTHSDIDEIVVVCLDGWQEVVRVYGKQFHITKLKAILAGGENAQKSTYIGLQYLKEQLQMKKGDIVVIHDAIRPMVSERLITKSMQMCRKCGMGVAAIYIMDAIMHTEDGKCGYDSINRNEIMKIQTPQSFDFDYIWSMHNQAIKEGKIGFWDNTGMLTSLDEKIYFSEGSDLNMKVNSTEDVAMFKALYKMAQDSEEE